MALACHLWHISDSKPDDQLNGVRRLVIWELPWQDCVCGPLYLSILWCHILWCAEKQRELARKGSLKNGNVGSPVNQQPKKNNVMARTRWELTLVLIWAFLILALHYFLFYFSLSPSSLVSSTSPVSFTHSLSFFSSWSVLPLLPCVLTLLPSYNSSLSLSLSPSPQAGGAQ